MDRRLLARLLACAPDGETVEITALDAGMCLGLWGNDWYGRLMGLRGCEARATFETRAA